MTEDIDKSTLILMGSTYDISKVQVYSSKTNFKEYIKESDPTDIDQFKDWYPKLEVTPGQKIILYQDNLLNKGWYYCNLKGDVCDIEGTDEVCIDIPSNAKGISILYVTHASIGTGLLYGNDSSTGWVKNKGCYPYPI